LKFKVVLVFNSSTLKLFIQFLIDLDDGDFILLETVQDLHSLISSSKEKYEKGLSIPISVVEWPLNKSSTEAIASVAPADSLHTADAMIREKDAEIIRLSKRIKALELRKFYFFLLLISFSKEYNCMHLFD